MQTQTMFASLRLANPNAGISPNARNTAAFIMRGETMLSLSRRRFTALMTATAAVGRIGSANAQNKPTIRVSSLTLPVFNPLVWNIMKARDFDDKRGFNLDIHAYPSISSFYAAFATGETDTLFGGPTIFQKLFAQGVPVRIIASGFTLADLVIFAKNPKIKSLTDLKGRQLAIDMGSSQYQVVKIYCDAEGINLGKDITVVDANFAVARAQLEANRVDAALVIEPLASIIFKSHPDWHTIFNGAQGWKEITGQSGWEIVPAIRADAIKRTPKAPQMMLAALQDVSDFMSQHTEEADKIAHDTLKLPLGIFTAAMKSGRLQLIVKPVWDPTIRKSISDMMQRAVQAGFYKKMPPETIFYAP